MHSVSDLTTSSRKTSGNVPPKLVGASTTVVGDKMYLFGGRLVAERRMVSDLYVFDLETFVWTKVPPYSGDDIPGARYFHSADSWQNYLIIFGGMGHKPDAASTDDLVVLNDVRFLDLSTFRWLSADPRSPTNDGDADPIDPVTTTNSTRDAFIPRARYAHLSSVSGPRLYIVGGQDLQNAWLDDVCVYDLRARRWAARRPYPRHAGTYRSVAVAAQQRVRDPAQEVEEDRTAHNASSSLGPPGGRFNVDHRPPSGKAEYTPSENLVHLPYSTEPTDDFPNDIFLYSNYNFTDVKRELEVFTPKSGSGGDFEMSDRSAAMTGTVLPPGLRFPTGAICGNHLIFAGTYLAHSYQSYSIWALDLTTKAWSRLDPGAALSTGSWFRSALWNSPAKGTSSLLIFGNRQGSLVEDYNRRLLAWDDVAVLDLEAFGIYQPPPRELDAHAQELGLAALEEGLFADFELVCDDGRRIACSRRLLESRWPWFRDQQRVLREAATRAISANQDILASATNAPPLPPNGELLPAPVPLVVGQASDPRPDPRMTPRALLLGEPYAVALALLQYFYTQSLLTPLQHAPAVLSQLLLLGAAYNLLHLQRLVRHAMHRALAPATSVGVYEVATLCGCQSLQIRALKAVMASSRRNTGRTRGNSNAGAGGGASAPPPPPRGGGSDRDRSGSDAQGPNARSRGMSDVRGLGFTSHSGSGGPGRDSVMGRNANTNTNGAMRVEEEDAMWPEDVSSSDADADLDGEGESEMSGREAEDMERRADTATPTAASAPLQKRSRTRHTVNLSMDSLYMALQAADGDADSGSEAEYQPDSCVDPYLPPLVIPTKIPLPLSPGLHTATSPSMMSPVPRSPELDFEEELKRNSDKEERMRRARARMGLKNLDVETASVKSGLSPIRHRAYTALADLAIPAFPIRPPSPSAVSFQSSVGASPRSSLLVSTASMYQVASTPSPTSAGVATPVMPYPRLSAGMQNSVTADDSDATGGSNSSRSARPSPLTPDSPPLPTPGGNMDTANYVSFSPYSGLEVIDETEGMYEVNISKQNGANGTSKHPLSPPPLSPSGPSLKNATSHESYMSGSTMTSTNSTTFGQGNGYSKRNSNGYGHVQFVDIVEPESDGRAGWTDLRAPRSIIVAPEQKILPQPPLSASPVIANTIPERSPHSSTFAASINSGASENTDKRGSGTSGSSFLSKARLKTKKRHGAATSPLTPIFDATMPYHGSVDGSDSGGSAWMDTRDAKKAAKAEEKKRKKAEEKARLDALAMQFSQGRIKGKDAVSVKSNGSSERRRLANEWVEDSAGMYGGMSWGGL